MEGEVVRVGFERKFLVPESVAEPLLTSVGTLLPPDPHGACYAVTSLYLDTPDRASYHGAVAGKWRLRRYGDEGTALFAEFKARPEPGRVHKRRTLCAGGISPDELPGWFRKSVLKESLAPVCLIRYTRDAFVGPLEGQQVRLTLDRNIAASDTRFWSLTAQTAPLPLTPLRVLEIKFERELPPSLAALLDGLGLGATPFSKYRNAMDRL